jgi:hypothetical protein
LENDSEFVSSNPDALPVSEPVASGIAGESSNDLRLDKRNLLDRALEILERASSAIEDTHEVELVVIRELRAKNVVPWWEVLAAGAVLLAVGYLIIVSAVLWV